MKKILKKFTLILLIFFNFKNISCMEQKSCNITTIDEKTIPQEIIMRLYSGNTVKDSLDSIQDIDINFKNYIYARLFNIYKMIHHETFDQNHLKSVYKDIPYEIIFTIKETLDLLKKTSDKTESLIDKIFIQKIINEIRIFARTSRIFTKEFFCPQFSDANFLDIVLQEEQKNPNTNFPKLLKNVLSNSHFFNNINAVKLLEEKYNARGIL